MGVSGSGLPTKMQGIWKPDWGRRHFQAHKHGCGQNVWTVGLRALVPHWHLAWDYPQVLTTSASAQGTSLHGSFLHQSDQARMCQPECADKMESCLLQPPQKWHPSLLFWFVLLGANYYVQPSHGVSCRAVRTPRFTRKTQESKVAATSSHYMSREGRLG